MLVKICREPETLDLPEELFSFNLDIDKIPDFIMQLKKYGISWETTNVNFLYIKSTYSYYPAADDENEKFYFHITVKEDDL